MPHLTPEAKAKLSATIRSLRDRLLTDLHNAVEGIYRLSLTLAKAGLAEEQHIKRQRLEQRLSSLLHLLYLQPFMRKRLGIEVKIGHKKRLQNQLSKIIYMVLNLTLVLFN